MGAIVEGAGCGAASGGRRGGAATVEGGGVGLP